MIFEAILHLLSDLFLWVAQFVGLPGVPEWAMSSYTATRYALVGMGPICSWVAWEVCGYVFAGVVGVWIWAMGTAGFRQLLSFVTGGGLGGGK